nr:hypothetical protein Iba_chr10cCG5460 [Ipomoea batatas]
MCGRGDSAPRMDGIARRERPANRWVELEAQSEESRSFSTSFSNLLDPAEGLTASELPCARQGSLPTPGLPTHQPPGVNSPSDLLKSSLSISSRTGSSVAKVRANGAPLWTMSSKCSIVKFIGFCFGGLSHFSLLQENGDGVERGSHHSRASIAPSSPHPPPPNQDAANSNSWDGTPPQPAASSARRPLSNPRSNTPVGAAPAMSRIRVTRNRNPRLLILNVGREKMICALWGD